MTKSKVFSTAVVSANSCRVSQEHLAVYKERAGASKRKPSVSTLQVSRCQSDLRLAHRPFDLEIRMVFVGGKRDASYWCKCMILPERGRMVARSSGQPTFTERSERFGTSNVSGRHALLPYPTFKISKAILDISLP